MTRIILVRHGETQTNTKGKIHKYSDTEELTPNGIKQIEKTSEAINKEQPNIIFCSQEKRARQSARIISSKLNIPLIEVPCLEERNWGDYAGLSFQEIKQKAGMDSMSFDQRFNFVPPNGESWKETEERLLKALNKIVSENKGKTIVLVTHGGPIRIYMPTLLNVSKEESYKYDPDNASISIFDYKNGKFSKITYNDISHLNTI
jgi:broad specificity phosphatase PhoE